MDPDALARELEDAGPAIVCAQAGNVNTGAFDPLEPIEYLLRAVRRVAARRRRVRPVGGGVSPKYRHLTRGLERADSLGHRRPQVAQRPLRRRPGDRHATAPRTAARCASPPPTWSQAEQRDNYDYTPEASRRARGFALYAALRSLGRRGVAELVERNCDAGRPLRRSCCATAAPRSSTTSCSTRCSSPRPPSAVARIQADGTCWAGGTVWHGREALRHLGLQLGHHRRRRRAVGARRSSGPQRFLRNSSTASPLLSKRRLGHGGEVVAGLVPAGEVEVDQVDRRDAALDERRVVVLDGALLACPGTRSPSRRARRPRAGRPTSPASELCSHGIARSLSATKSSRTSSLICFAYFLANGLEPRRPVP